jgi:hypothetical protein
MQVSIWVDPDALSTSDIPPITCALNTTYSFLINSSYARSRQRRDGNRAATSESDSQGGAA